MTILLNRSYVSCLLVCCLDQNVAADWRQGGGGDRLRLGLRSATRARLVRARRAGLRRLSQSRQ